MATADSAISDPSSAVDLVLGDRVGSDDAQAMGNVSDLDDDTRLQTTETLIKDYHADVYRYAFWLTGCRASAEDITQESFLRAFRGLHNLRDMKAAKGWLFTIARNEFARWCKRSATKSTTQLAEDAKLAEDESQAAETQEWVRSAIAELPEDFRLVLVMYYYEQSSYAEIAQQLDIPIGTVMSRLSRGKTQMKKVLDRLSEPNPKPGDASSGAESHRQIAGAVQTNKRSPNDLSGNRDDTNGVDRVR